MLHLTPSRVPSLLLLFVALADEVTKCMNPYGNGVSHQTRLLCGCHPTSACSHTHLGSSAQAIMQDASFVPTGATTYSAWVYVTGDNDHFSSVYLGFYDKVTGDVTRVASADSAYNSHVMAFGVR